ncbi:MAG: HepT-like ribonuclease domain-containing protein [Sporichthyaceae bacterium]
MSRRNGERLNDILAAAKAIAEHLRRGEIDDGLVFDAVRVRLIEIGEAVGAIDPELLAREPEIPWTDVKAMRNHLAHRYFDTAHSIVADTIATDLPPLLDAVGRLIAQLEQC